MRNLGLDIVRSIAILLVLVCHFFGIFYFTQQNGSPLLMVFGAVGVEIFFVLSGFLIGDILIKEVLKIPTFKSIFRFIIRRWFRTLPLYYMMIIVLVFEFRLKLPIQYLFFIQNSNRKIYSFLGEAWSLSVEEWFYFTIPFVFFFFSKLFRIMPNLNFKKTFLSFIILLIVFFISFRFIFAIHFPQADWDFDIRKSLFLRMDSLLIGVLGATIKNFFPSTISFINNAKNNKIFIFISSFSILFLSFYNFLAIKANTINTSIFFKVFYFPLFCIFVLFFIILIHDKNLSIHKKHRNKINTFFTFISKTSYCVYLIHSRIFITFKLIFTSPFTPLLSLILVYFIATISYHYFEKPILKLRDKLMA